MINRFTKSIKIMRCTLWRMMLCFCFFLLMFEIQNISEANNEPAKKSLFPIYFQKRHSNPQFCENTTLFSPLYSDQFSALDENFLTFATHGTVGYTGKLNLLASRWPGPISMAVYLSGNYFQKFDLLFEMLTNLTLCHSNLLQRLRLQVYFENNNLNTSCPVFEMNSKYRKLFDSPMTNQRSGRKCVVNEKDVRAEEDTDALEGYYPFNTGRNLAKANAGTEWILLADMDFQPSLNLSAKSKHFLRSYAAPDQEVKKEVFVLPTFEVKDGNPHPDNKDQLLKLYKAKKAQYFHAKYYSVGHRIPDKNAWLYADAELNPEEEQVWIHKTTKGRSIFWEPVYISSHFVPKFDESFRGYGHNKVQQIYEMCMANFSFHILNGVFLSHLGYKKHSQNSRAKDASKTRNSNRFYYDFLRRMRKKYGVTNEKICRKKWRYEAEDREKPENWDNTESLVYYN